MTNNKINIQDVVTAAEKYVTSTYSHEPHYTALIWKTLIDEFNVPVSHALLCSPWIDNDWVDTAAPSKACRPDIVVLSGPQSYTWCKNTKVFTKEDYKKALLIIEVKRISGPIGDMKSDINRLAKLRNNSDNQSTQVALVIIDDQLHIVDNPTHEDPKKRRVRTDFTNKLSAVNTFANQMSVPIYMINF